MIAPETLFKALQAEGVGFVSGVPDSLLKEFCAYAQRSLPPENHVINANEGAAVAAAAGYHLGTGRLGLVYLQNSGIGNAVNPLVSLADPAVYAIPMVLLIGWRGEPGVKDEPQHVKQGVLTCPLLDVLGIPFRILGPDTDDAEDAARWACGTARQISAPVALVVRKDTFSKPNAPRDEEPSSAPSGPTLSRERAIEIILGVLGETDRIVSTTGKISRELYELRKQRGQMITHDFLTVGSMGHASQIALGLAIGQSARNVYCLDGDGAALMHMGSLAIAGQCAPGHFRHIVLNNAAHESVGGQPTVADAVDLTAVAAACGYRTLERADTEETLAGAVVSLKQTPGPAFLEVRVALGARKDLGRPKESPVENKKRFMGRMGS